MKRMIKSIILLSIIFVNTICLANANQADSIQALINNEVNPIKLAHLNLEYSWNIKYKDPKMAIQIAEGNLDILNEFQDQNGIAIAYSYLGAYHYLNNEIPLGIKFLKKAETLFIKQKNYQRLAKVYNNLGIAYSDIFDYQSSLFYYNKVLDIKKKKLVHSDISTNLINISTIHYDQGEYQKCIETNEEALILTLQKNNYESTAIIYANLGAAHERIGNYKKSINYALKALDIYQNEIQNPMAQVRTYTNLGSTYMSQDLLEEAKHYYNKAIEQNAELNNSGRHVVILNNLAELERKSNHLNKAKKNALEALVIAKKTNYYEEELVSLQTLSNIEKERKDFKQAMSYYVKYIELSDSILEISSYNQTQLALAQNQIAIDNLKKEKENSQELQLEERSKIIYAIGCLLLISILVWISIYFIQPSISIHFVILLNFLTSTLLVVLILLYLFVGTDLIDQWGTSSFLFISLGIFTLSVIQHNWTYHLLHKRLIHHD